MPSADLKRTATRIHSHVSDTNMAALIQSLARQAQATFTRSFLADEASTECLSRLQRMASQLTCKDVSLDEKLLHNMSKGTTNGVVAPVTYVSVFENRTFTMSIFIVKRGARIPLHDHPGMYGILKVIYGSAKISSYSEVRRRSPDPDSDRVDCDTIEVRRHPDETVGADASACRLTPSDRNFHEIVAVDGTIAFLDILAPPYNMKDRDCHYYRVACEQSGTIFLSEIAPPRDFWCDSVPYVGPPIHLTEDSS